MASDGLLLERKISEENLSSPTGWKVTSLLQNHGDTERVETLCGKRNKLESYSEAVSTRRYFCRVALFVCKLHRGTLRSVFRFISLTQLGAPNITM